MKHSLTDAQRQLITPDIMGYADSLAHRFLNRGIDLDDLRQEACYGACLAALNYDASKHVDFKTYAHFYMMRAIVAAFDTYENMMKVPASDRPYIHMLSLDLALSEDGDDGTGYISDDEAPAPCDIIDEEPEEEPLPDVRQLFTVLTRQERRAIQCLFGIDHPQLSRRETARRLKITPERVRVLYNKALMKMGVL